jgi:enoyl-[acyl-carrier protein] reductase II
VNEIMTKRITELFNIDFPIVQAGMVWCSGWNLASTVSNAGGLGIIGAGSMYPEILREHIRKFRLASNKPFAVNVPLLYPALDEIFSVIIEENVPIVFTSAGNPALWTSRLKASNITVVHVVSSAKFALKAQHEGVDAVVAEGFEAGGHNGREETTTMVLIPLVASAVSIPVIAAGGISSGRSMLAAIALGAAGVQIGTRFAASAESSAHTNFKNLIINITEGETVLTLKQITPVRVIKNEFYREIEKAERRCATKEELVALLGKRRAKIGMFEGNLNDGELEIGQVSALVSEIESASDIVSLIWTEFLKVKRDLQNELP